MTYEYAALTIRQLKGSACIECRNRPPVISVTAAPANASAKNGHFSAISAMIVRTVDGGRDGSCRSVRAEATHGVRPSGQKSSSSNTNGSVTSIGLDIKPKAKQTHASP